ncbi:lipid-binding SYLF domain-containing protein [Fimbriiglobus ruber]|uniref:Ysc84 actin-binding domain-containing protein n=1 Tax=Fimbriiglobus ruber TaxID=1908690 RepID=A0A225DNY3_9BACT|nr:lipid-binding SYLF domain-containing protein [Fimbriiglobus ruber]OWK40288.1 hypothetical protein FRUB_05207 [Fimbriiglobus ruber]
MSRITLALLALIAIPTLATAAPPAGDTLRAADEVLIELNAVPAKCIPRALLEHAEAVAIIPHVIRAGLIIGGREGHGVVVIKDQKGWGDIRFIELNGASVGFQAGVQSSDVVLVFKTRGGLERLLEGKKKLTLGGDLAVAAGPLGREASAETDARLKAEVVSYSRSHGLFAGVSLDGVVLSIDHATNDRFIRDAGPETHKAAEALKIKLAELTAERLPPPPVRR